MKSYSEEVKQQVIERYLSREPSASILADTGIPKSTFYNWVRTYQEKQKDSRQKIVSVRNFHLLENKVARLEGIIEILKSVDCTVSAPLRQRLCAAEHNISRGTFYNHILRNKKDNTWYTKRKEKLRIRIQEIYDESNQIFGAEKIAAVMKSEGIKISKEMVRTLMREMGLVSIRQSAKKLYEDKIQKSIKTISTRNLMPLSPMNCGLVMSLTSSMLRPLIIFA